MILQIRRVIKIVREELIKRATKGERCPVCFRMSKVYKRKLTEGMSRWLIWIVKTYKTNGQKPIHIKEGPAQWGGDSAKLMHWGLIQSIENDNPKKKTSGMWYPTEKGIQFVANTLKVPRRIHLLNNKVIGQSNREVTIAQTFKVYFDYEELMRS